MSRGLSLDTNYTWNHINDWVSYQSDTDSINVINPFDPGAYRGTSDLEIRHRMTMRSVWEIPGPKKGLLHSVLGGWQMSGIWSWQSGAPFTVFDGGNVSYTGIGNELADIVAPVHYTSGSSRNRVGPTNTWFTVASFTDNAFGTFGNSRRNMLRGPRSFNVDAALQKNLAITERLKLEYRAEFFNVLNHPSFGVPDSTLADGSAFGTITNVSQPRVLQMALKLTF